MKQFLKKFFQPVENSVRPFAELDAAIELYRRHGFVEAERVEHVVWGARRTEMRMTLDQVF